MAQQTFPLKTGQTLELGIVSLSSEGRGIGRFEGLAVFVPYTLPGDRITAKVTRLQKNFAEAELIELLSPSEYRISPVCPVFGSCGACSLMHAKYSAQLELKRIIVEDAIHRIGGFGNISVPPVLGMTEPLRYRNKAVFPFGNRNGRVVFGCYGRKSHNLIPIDDCLLQANDTITVMKTVCEWANAFGIEAYSPGSKGILRNAVIRITDGGIMVVIVTTGALPHRDELVSMLTEALPAVRSVIHNINPDDTNLVMGRKSRTVFGSPTVTDRLGELRFDVSAESFLQVNPSETLKLYSVAIDALDIKPTDSVIDLYCGIGTISLLAAKRAKHVLGIEVVPSAIENAKANAVKNGITNAEFICGAVEDIIPKLLTSEKQDFTSLILDPPRKGADPKAIEAIIASGIPRLAYVSCNPATLARDCKLLSSAGYTLEQIRPVDMFPETEHVETVCLLSKLKSTQHIEVELDMDELDLTDAEKKATYQKIKEYVLEHTSLKVSSLYIAQVKQKCGIIECENYNKPKSEDAKQPQCPAEKEKAIMEALKHFGMI